RIRNERGKHLRWIGNSAARNCLIRDRDLREVAAWRARTLQHPLHVVAPRIEPREHELAVREVQRRVELVSIGRGGRRRAVGYIRCGPGARTPRQWRDHDARFVPSTRWPVKP